MLTRGGRHPCLAPRAAISPAARGASWLDATYVKVRHDHRIVSVAVIVAVGVNTDGRREVLGITTGDSEAEPLWTECPRHRGLRGVTLVVCDAHDGLKAAITKVLKATWQRCRFHFMRNAMAHAGKTQRRIVAARIGTASVVARMSRMAFVFLMSPERRIS
jgi:putative transposase